MVPSTIAHYRVNGKLGEGGMGEVWRATDTKLGRDVAIKILPESFAADPDRLARFAREARVLASLNHPNIAVVHGVEERALVMELVEGPTLAERIARGAIPIEEALGIARQIAEALEYAHERGVIHRDLKPANIKMTADGRVKILDFGLAKALSAEAPADPARSPMSSPTLTIHAGASGVGTILGTAAYMSPEQARGQMVDKRADIWSFGVVLFEMLTGRRAFAGETISDTLAAVLKTDPDWSALPADTPPSLRTLLRRCLERDRKKRLRDIGDAFLEEVEVTPPQPFVPGKTSRRAYLTGAAGLLLGGAGAWFARGSRRPDPTRVYRFQVAPGPGQEILLFSLSPDGHHLAMIISQEGKTGLWLRRLDTETAQFVPGSEGAGDGTTPFWSSDSRQVGFATRTALMKYSLLGGRPAETIFTHPPGAVFGASWNSRGTILFGTFTRGLHRCAATGGTPEIVAASDDPGISLMQPVFLPGGEKYLYVRRGVPRPHDLYASSLGSKESMRVGDLSNRAEFVPSIGQLVHVRGTSLYAQEFDPEMLRLKGSPKRVAANVGISSSTAAASFSASDTGVIAWSTRRYDAYELFWRDRSGKQIARVGALEDYSPTLTLFAGDRNVLIAKYDAQTELRDWYSVDTKTGAAKRLTFSKPSEFVGSGTLSPDGAQIAFELIAGGKSRIVRQPIEGGAPETVLEGNTRLHAYLTQWSPDGRFLIVDYVGQPRRCELIELKASHGITPLHGPQVEWGLAVFSPDVRYIAHTSQDGLFVEPYPGTGQRWLIHEHGYYPVWRRDGAELFFMVPPNRLMATRVSTDRAGFRFSTPVPLFETAFRLSYARPYDVTADGQRFLLCEARPDPDNPPVNVLVNWPQALREKE